MTDEYKDELMLKKNYDIFFNELLSKRKSKKNNENDIIELENNDKIKLDTLQTLIDNIQEGVAIIQGNKTVIINSSLCRILGYTFDELISTKTQQIYRFIHPDSYSILYKITYEYFSGNLSKKTFELKAINKNKKNIWLEITIIPIKINSKSAIQITATDITRTKESTAALVKNMEKFNALVSAIPAYVSFKDINLNYVSVNKKFSDLIGKSIGEISGKNDFEIFEKINAEKFRKTDLEILNEGKIITNKYESFIDSKNETRWILTNKVPYRDIAGAIIGIVGITIEITDYKRSEEEKKMFFELSPDIVAIFDFNGIIKEVNQSWKDLLEWDTNDYINDKFLDYVHADDVLKTRDSLKEVINGNKLVSFDNRCLKKNGDYKWLSWNTRFLKDRNLIFAVAHDITKRKKMENDLIETNIQAMSATKAKTEFLANMSHELRTPLNSILGFSQLLNMDNIEELTETQKSYLNYIHNSGEHLLEMVNDILDLSKIESGKISISKEFFDLNELLDRVLVTLKSLISQKELNLTVTVSKDIGMIEADQIRIKQVLYNLISNSIKFTENGKKIGIDAYVSQGEVCITVWDEGKGIPEDMLKKIFIPFEQINMSDEKSGTGLGLPIAKKLIELHGGDIHVSSKLGEGSRFTIILKNQIFIKSDKKIVSDGKIKSKYTFSSTNKDVLIVDDNESNLDFMKHVLNKINVNCQVAYSGDEAIKKLNNNTFSIIFMDIQMPKMSGNKACKIIKTINNEIPVIALTAYAMKGDKEKYISEGFDGYISKPVDVELLQEVISKYIN